VKKKFKIIFRNDYFDFFRIINRTRATFNLWQGVFWSPLQLMCVGQQESLDPEIRQKENYF
jgi:hypothetical protein